MKSLPFRPYFVKRIADGKKRCTARTQKYGEVGDRLKTAAGTIELTEVARVPLEVVRDHYWPDEGCESPEDFERVWNAIHPRKGYDPAQQVWLHRFIVVAGDGQPSEDGGH